MRIALLVSRQAPSALAIGASWAVAGDTVTIVLLDAAAAVARVGHEAGDALARAQAAGAIVVVHDDALRRRALIDGALADGLKVVDLDEVADLLVDGADRAVWL